MSRKKVDKIDNQEKIKEKESEQEVFEAADESAENEKNKAEDISESAENNKDIKKKETDSEDAKDDKDGEYAEKNEKDELAEKYLRLAADFQNYKRRTENEKNEIFAYANEKIIKELLTVMDNFERALPSVEESSDKKLSDGIKMIYKQMAELLQRFGVKEIESQGSDFDPNFHHAVLSEPSDEFESNKIIETMQKGYTLNGKVIRPAMVKVAE